MIAGNIIGKYAEASLDAATRQGGSNWVDPVNTLMDCPTMMANAQLLQGQIDHFSTEIQTADSRTAANLQKILDFQQPKLDAYNSAMASKCNLVEGSGPGGQAPGTTGTDGTAVKTNWTPIIIGGAAILGLILYMRKK